MRLIDLPLHYNRTAGSGNFDANGATLFHSGSSRRWQIDGHKLWRQTFTCLLRLADPAPKQVGVEIIIQSNAGNRLSRTVLSATSWALNSGVY